jgi:hypothetical protein
MSITAGDRAAKVCFNGVGFAPNGRWESYYVVKVAAPKSRYTIGGF